MSTREEQIKKFGVEIVEDDERVWRERGYTVNYKTGLLEQIKENCIDCGEIINNTKNCISCKHKRCCSCCKSR